MRGAYVWSQAYVPINTIVDVTIFLPKPLRKLSGLITCRMRAQRVESAIRKKTGIAFSTLGKDFALKTAARRPTKTRK